ncbi:uncharacterized protein [Mytilus edulis]|uniref:uncharacterized protein isoform X2 n=1 Tax=Mytilus edulis TaxID=6550 RepID=UPI0039EFCA28
MMDIYSSYYLDEDSYLFDLSDSDSYDEKHATDYYHLYANGLERKLIKPYIENKEEHIQGLELHSKNTYSSKLKSHSVRVRSIRESVHQCKTVLAAIVEKDFKDILNAFNNGAEEVSSPQLFAAMCFHHVSSLSYTEKLNISNILNNLPEYIGPNTTDAMNANFLDLFFRNLDPERCFDLISRIWHLYLDIENALKYSLCKIIIESERPGNERFLCANIKNLAYLWKTDNGNRKDPLLVLSLLYHAVTSEQIEDVKFIKSIIATHMDCKELVEALTIYKLNCNTAKLLSFQMLILNLDDILMTCPQQKQWLLFSYLSKLFALKHYEGFKATIINFQQFFLSDNCRMIRILPSSIDPKSKHAYSTLLLHLLYFCITTNQHEKELCALSEILAIANHVTDYRTGSIDFFFSLITHSTDRNNQHSLIFTEVLLQLWEKRMDLKLAVMLAYIAYLRKSKCLELHGNFVQYHFQCKSTSCLGLSQYGSNLEWDENILFVIHYISNLSEMTSFNIKMNETKFLSSFRKYVTLCDETQILCVPDTIEKVGIICESDKILLVHAILIYGTELFKRDCFERYKWLVIRYQSLLIFELPKRYNRFMLTNIYSNQICFVTCLNLLQHYTIFDQCTKMKRLRSKVLFYCKHSMEYIFSDYMSTHSKDQFISTSLSLQYIWKGMRYSHEKLQCLVIFWKKILESGCTDQFKDFIVDNKNFILSMKNAALDYGFKYKTEYCVLLFHLLRECIMSNNNRDMNLALSAINDQKRNMLNEFGDSLKSKPKEIAEEERRVFRSNVSRLYTIDEVLNGNLELHEYVRAVIDNYRDHSEIKDYVFKIFTYYLQNLTTAHQEKGLIGLIAFVGDAPIGKRYYDYIKSEMSSLMFDVVYSFLVLKHEVDQTKLATFLLHLNHKCHSKLVKKVTVEAGKILKWKTLAPQNITTEENMVIYKCFCIVRQTKKTYRVQEINLEEYMSYFDFIEMIDQEEQRQRIIRQTILLLVLLLLHTSITSDDHHKSAKLKKYLSLKYAYDDLALYLLWCSGDVEINPGPTFSKIRPMHASEKERKWISEVCSVLVKLLKELPETSKPKALWKEKPTDWPTDEPFFDPYNKSKVQNDDLLSDERLLKCLMRCCDEKKICIPEGYRYEINLFSNNNKPLLFETYIFRKEKHNLCEALSNLLMCKDREKINQETKNCGLTLNFEITQTSQKFMVTKRKGEIITRTRRDLAVMLCKIIKGLTITDKCDGIWKTPPSKWPSDEPFYSPHNEKKRQGICQDKELVDNLIKYCKSNLVVIPPQYQDMVSAWKERHMDELINIHTIYANIVKLEHSLKILQIEGILSKPDILDFLEKAGLTLDTDTWRLDDVKTDGNQIASRKRSHKLLVNPITSVDTAVKKLSSCDRGNRQFQKLNVSKKTIEDSRNTLLSTTDKTSVDADSICPESTYTRKKPLKLTESEEFNSQTYVPSSQEEEDKLKKQLEEPAPPLSEASQKCCPPDFDNILNSLLNSRDLENSINVDVY